jgi:hypothetical protein
MRADGLQSDGMRGRIWSAPAAAVVVLALGDCDYSLPAVSDVADGDTVDADAAALDGGSQDADAAPLDAADAEACAPETDIFAGTFDGWTYFGIAGYTLSLDPNDSALLISGDQDTSPGNAGMQKTFAIVPGTFRISFGWRASSGGTQSNTTNANLQIVDAQSPSTVLHNVSLISGGTTDSMWETYTGDLSQYVMGRTSVTVQLYLADAWQVTYWDQQNWYKDIVVNTCP